jgi:hypothetical protein
LSVPRLKDPGIRACVRAAAIAAVPGRSERFFPPVVAAHVRPRAGTVPWQGAGRVSWMACRVVVIRCRVLLAVTSAGGRSGEGGRHRVNVLGARSWRWWGWLFLLDGTDRLSYRFDRGMGVPSPLGGGGCSSFAGWPGVLFVRAVVAPGRGRGRPAGWFPLSGGDRWVGSAPHPVLGRGFGGGLRLVGCLLFVNCIVDASIFVAKFLRAHGGCLGIRSR